MAFLRVDKSLCLSKLKSIKVLQKTSYFQEKSFEKDSKLLVSDSILNANQLITHIQRLFQNKLLSC